MFLKYLSRDFLECTSTISRDVISYDLSCPVLVYVVSNLFYLYYILYHRYIMIKLTLNKLLKLNN
jgi:hypothetical protein